MAVNVSRALGADRDTTGHYHDADVARRFGGKGPAEYKAERGPGTPNSGRHSVVSAVILYARTLALHASDPHPASVEHTYAGYVGGTYPSRDRGGESSRAGSATGIAQSGVHLAARPAGPAVGDEGVAARRPRSSARGPGRPYGARNRPPTSVHMPTTIPRLLGDPNGPRAWTPDGSLLVMRESLWVPTHGPLPTLQNALRLLDARLDQFRQCDAHLLPDRALRDLAIDVDEQVRAVGSLVAASHARAAFANARAALESALDAVALTQDEAAYDRGGADVYVSYVLEFETLGRRFGTEATRLLGQSEDAEMGIDAAAAAWDAAAPGKGAVIRQAFEEFPKRPESTRRHWSGLTGRQLYALVTATLPAGNPMLARVLDGIYGMLSMEAHPRPRFGRWELAGDGEEGSSPADPEGEGDVVHAIAWIAVSLTVRALDARWQFADG